jgi:hypothetical protein
VDSITTYLSKTKSAVQKLFDAINSYYAVLYYPPRPAFAVWGDDDNIRNTAYAKWREQNKELIEERLRYDNEFSAETFAMTTLCGSVLQFAYMGIKLFSNNSNIPSNFSTIIKHGSVAEKFCIGRSIDNVPVGLIIYAGRNQSHHYDERNYREPTQEVFKLLSNWYSPTFKKEFIHDCFDLNNPRITNFAEHILDKLQWQVYSNYESEMLAILEGRNEMDG